MACLGLFFGTMHAVGHLTGSFVHGSQLPQSKGVAHLLGSKEYAATYWSLLASTPGWTGLAALLVFCIMATCAHPWVRKRNYEVFQASHFLMFPLIALLCAHGTARLLQYPMLGFWLAPPAVLVLLERGHRIYRGFVRIPASIKALDKETVAITCHNRHGKPWRYTAGQYIFLQVPDVSIFEWHPFTVSHCSGDVLQLHIKTDGNWTRQLRSLPSIIEVGIDGPFGAPAQRFYEYDRSLIIGASTGVTPFAAILSDLELKIFEDQDGWSRHRSRGMSFSRSTSRPRSTHHKSHNSSVISLQPRGRSLSVFDSAPSSRAPSQSRSPSLGLGGLGTFMSNDSMTELQATLKVPCSKRVDFHWIVREKNSLLWFSDLLNRTYDLSRTLPPGTLDLNLHTHVTLARTTVSEHIFRYLLDTYRTERNPVSALTGLKSRSHFGRPDFESILRAFHDDIRHEIKQGVTQKGQKIAVFYCGGQALGSILSDLCYDLTMKGRQDGSASRWDFRMEVFG
jgi:respiratory burst oxidase